mmetsp:Transcript_91701/g.145034  ORF Transcript_91701/g.145034 Transcript_91701/m.145034 type:complete len:90 (+) Transcript_91701:3-272(+)
MCGDAMDCLIGSCGSRPLEMRIPKGDGVVARTAGKCQRIENKRLGYGRILERHARAILRLVAYVEFCARFLNACDTAFCVFSSVGLETF